MKHDQQFSIPQTADEVNHPYDVTQDIINNDLGFGKVAGR